MFKFWRKSKPLCEWPGHGDSHHSEVVIGLVLGRPCGHEVRGPFRTCLDFADLMLANHGVSATKSKCRDCGAINAVRVVDPEFPLTVESTPQADRKDPS